ncbi:MAG TPA: ATP-grasp domain-containing protein [Kineosporiaceae bacterium]|nr:ATP-grasp domain-containing protein [Kineosporiaceae bacterium]
MIEVKQEGLVLFGFSVALLGTLQGRLPDRSVLVVEEPDVARARGVDALAVDYPAVSRVIRAEYQDPAGLELLLASEPAIAGAAAVLPGGEYAVVPAAVVAERIGVRGASVAAARAFRDKFELRLLTSAAGLRNPGFALVDTIDQAEQFFLAADGRACVLKPTARQASAGVQIITEVAQIREGWRASADPDEGHRVPGRGVPSRVLFEHALSGSEYSIEALVADGQTVFSNVTAKSVRPGRFPVELGHTVPAVITPALRGELERESRRLVAATDLQNGILHSEWIVTGEGPTLIEGGARMPGDEIGTLISQAWGFDLSEAYLQLMLGQSSVVPGSATAGAAIVFLTAPPGELVALDGLEHARSLPGVCDVRVGVELGAVISPVTSSWDRVGQVRTRAGTAAQAQHLAQQAAAAIAITVRTPVPAPA